MNKHTYKVLLPSLLVLLLPLLSCQKKSNANADKTIVVWHWMTDRFGVLRQYPWPTLTAAGLASGMRWLMLLLMLIGGETLLKGQLDQTWFVLYWMICFLLTGLAISIAFLDAKIVQRRTRQEHRLAWNRQTRVLEKYPQEHHGIPVARE